MELKEVIHSIDKQLYSPSAVIAWDAEQLINTLKQQHDKTATPLKGSELQPLY